MVTQTNEAAWIQEPKGDLQVLPAPYPAPLQHEIVIKVRNNELIHLRVPMTRSNDFYPTNL